MKHIKLSALFVLFLGLAPLQAMHNGQDEAREEGSSVVAAAAQPVKTLSVSAATPWQKASSEVFILDAKTLAILKSKDVATVEKKRDLLAKAAQATALNIEGIKFQPGDKKTLLYFLPHCKKVDRLILLNVRLKQLPKLPFQDRLTCLALNTVWLETIEGIADYHNIQHLSLCLVRLLGSSQPDPTAWAPVEELRNLRSLRADRSCRFSVSKVMQNNQHLEKFDHNGVMSTDALSALPSSLRQLALRNAHLDDKTLALLPTEQLEKLLLENNTFTSLEPLRNAPVRVLRLEANKQLDQTLAQVIYTMPNLESLNLAGCDLEDAHTKPLFALADKLKSFNLLENKRLSEPMREKLCLSFGDKVSFEGVY
ncbi:MAG: hypothetical protein ACPGUZ_00770 [Holosporaceae bacterium]